MYEVNNKLFLSALQIASDWNNWSNIIGTQNANVGVV